MSKAILQTFLTSGQITADVVTLADNSLKEFTALDKSGDGVLSLDEFKKVPATPAEAERIFSMMDLDQSKTISKAEYVKFQVMNKLMVNLMPKFKEMDKNNDGTLTMDELRDYLAKQNFDSNRINRALQSADKNKDGKIDYLELSNILHRI